MKSDTHRALVEHLRRCFRQSGCLLTAQEHHHADLVAIKMTASGLCVFAGEIELTPRHVLVNLLRDFSANGCRFVAVVCPDAEIRARVARKIGRHLPERHLSQVNVFCESELDTEKFRNWIWSATGEPEPNGPSIRPQFPTRRDEENSRTSTTSDSATTKDRKEVK